ncbi:hypothetical protein RhiLY_13883 [Ceratobasidium sp. AG-Ba]|nr:hypothetical protein RhiLY_13883 [Ceratobasidium sp. AG-Ba]
MSLSTRRPPGAGLPSSVRAPRSASSVRGREPPSRTQDDSYSVSSSDNKFRSAQRSRSVPRKEFDNPYRSERRDEVPPVPSPSSRHSVQSSVSSSSSGSSAVSTASTAPSSVWDYVGWKGNTAISPTSNEERVPSPEPAQAHLDNGNTLWSRVTAAAGGLSVNIGKAWEAKDDMPEPDTPPGHDSRVTVALKKHYIKQVSDPRQLPAWLFSDIERQVGRSRRTEDVASRARVNDEPVHVAPAPSRSRARHEEAYAQPRVMPSRERTQVATYDDEYKGPTRAATRLRAMRDARRGPIVEPDIYESVPAPAALEPEPEPQPVVAAPPPRPRIGLPSRPTRPRRD